MGVFIFIQIIGIGHQNTHGGTLSQWYPQARGGEANMAIWGKKRQIGLYEVCQGIQAHTGSGRASTGFPANTQLAAVKNSEHCFTFGGGGPKRLNLALLNCR